MATNPRYWLSDVPELDDFGLRIQQRFIDGKTRMGPWAIMTPQSWLKHGIHPLGLGRGQRYEKQSDGRWLKMEG